MKAIILAGGGGTRLWPLSRQAYPKQFMKIGDQWSFLQKTARRCLGFAAPDELIFVTNREYRFHVEGQLRELQTGLDRHVLLEPAGRNTAPAIALAVKYAEEVLGCGDEEVLFIGPSDHLIAPEHRFAACARQAAEVARQGWLVTFGVVPNRPETGFGYLKRGDPLPPPAGEVGKGSAKPAETATGKGKREARDSAPPSARSAGASLSASGATTTTFGSATTGPSTGSSTAPVTWPTGVCRVERFVEKPNLERAQQYLATGCYLFNSGMFAFTIGSIKAEFVRHQPALAEAMARPYAELLAGFEALPSISIDYAVMEKAARVAVLPLTDITWSDVGSWDAVYETLPKDGQGNVTLGEVLPVDTHDSLIMGHDRLVATIGLRDVMVVETGDALLVAARDQSQKVKDVVQALKAQPRRETLTVTHPTVYRPWGSYTVLEEGPRYKLKRIVLHPGAKLSLQMHYHRSEHWIVVKGAGRVVVGDREQYFHENESVYVPKTTKHRLENPGKVPLEIIEVQVGEYVGEDDIERFEDIYRRA